MAALFVIALGCDLRIIEAINLGMEWRLDWPDIYRFAARARRTASDCAEAWYDGLLGGPSTAEWATSAPRLAALCDQALIGCAPRWSREKRSANP